MALYGNLTLYPFAISGSECSKDLTRHSTQDVVHDQLGLYLNFTANTTNAKKLSPSETVYSLWIGRQPVLIHNDVV